MKTIKYIFIAFALQLVVSCQKEEFELVDQNNPETLTKTSQLTSLIERVSQNTTSTDNILDNSSCFKVQLPVTVIVNGQNITVTTENDYQLVKNAIDAFSNDDDIVNFIYPITIQFKNFQTLVLNDAEALDDVIDDCGEDDGFDEIDCVKFVFPITINVYDSGSQTPEVLTFTSNSNLFNFLDNLDGDDLIEIKYPISVVDSNSQTIVINNNTQLENFIDDSIDDCDDTPSGGTVDPNFVSTITSGTWRISYFFEDEDETSDFAGYNFTFNVNGSLVVQNGSVVTNGTWSTFIDSGIQRVLLNIDGDTLIELEVDWGLIEFSNTTIRLKDVSSDDDITFLNFTKN